MKFDRIILTFFAAGLMLASCSQTPQGSEAEDDTNPFFRQASKYEMDQNFNAAIREYENALRANPMVAKAHLQMGLIYSEKLGDAVGGIYHLQRYLQARPEAQDKEQIQTYIDKAKIDFILSLPNSPLQNAEEVARIGKENIDLKQQVSSLQKQIAERDTQITQLKTIPAAPVATATVETTPATPAAASTAAQSTTTPAPAATSTTATATTTTTETTPATPASTEPRYHTIGKGDSLWKIASKYYPGEAKEGVEKIKQANPEATSNERNLKLGTKLLIP